MYLDWDEWLSKVSGCTDCRLCEGRTRVVPGEGDRHARLMFVGEGPGAEEDRQGRPFVGKAGQLLDKMIEAIGMRREEVYIANVVKCRPPGNRTPRPDEMEACIGHLRNQVALIRPRLIVCLGTPAAQAIIDKDARVSQVRGRMMERKGYWLFATWHPAALLRNETLKVDAWKDFQMIRDKLKALGDDGWTR